MIRDSNPIVEESVFSNGVLSAGWGHDFAIASGWRLDSISSILAKELITVCQLVERALTSVAEDTADKELDSEDTVSYCRRGPA